MAHLFAVSYRKALDMMINGWWSIDRSIDRVIDSNANSTSIERQNDRRTVGQSHFTAHNREGTGAGT